MARIITILRDCTLYQTAPELSSVVYVAMCSIVLLLFGYFIFDHLEPKFAEAI